MNDIHLLAPVPGRCRICGAKHEKGTPHDEKSAYYRMMKRQREKAQYAAAKKERHERRMDSEKRTAAD